MRRGPDFRSTTALHETTVPMRGSVGHPSQNKSVCYWEPSQWVHTMFRGGGGVAFMTALTVVTVLKRTLPSVCLSYKIQGEEATMTVSLLVVVWS